MAADSLYAHTPVLLAEVLQQLQPHPGGCYIDATLGGGGHASALLEAAQPGGRLLGLDADPAALATVQQRWQARAATLPPASYTLHHSSFDHLDALARSHQFSNVDGIVFDLGVSSHQLDTPERGFAFRADGPLDMRLDPTDGPTAADLVASLSETDLATILYRYGEERQSRRIARRIVAERQQHPITTTAHLAELVARASGKPGRPGGGRIHPATRTFQALRIAVNRELAQLESVLPQAVGLLKPGGRLVVISFHSLEDRIVKQFLRDESGYGGNEAPQRPVRLRILTRKPVVASEAEQQTNPRSRSAKLRAAERIAAG